MPLRLKLIILFLILALIPTIFVSILTFTHYKNVLETDRLSSLRDIAALKAEKIEAIFMGLKENIEMSQNFWNIKKNLPTLTRFSHDAFNPAFVEARKTLDEQLQPMQVILDLDAIMLLDTEGKLVYSTNTAYAAKNLISPLSDPGQKIFEEGKKGIYFSDVFLRKEANNSLDMFISAPALDSKSILIGVIVFDVNMPPIYDLIQDRIGLGNTGETAIGKKIGGWVMYLNPLRHDPEAALKKKIMIGSSIGIPMQKAVQGKEGVGISIDYRGIEAISAWRPVPSLGWGMVAEIDTKEAFEEVIKLRNQVVLILAIVFVILGAISASVSRAITSPINRLAKCAEIVGTGNLDCKADVSTKDEIGRLAQTFNKMLEDLKRSTTSIDNLNKEISERKIAEEKIKQAAEEWQRTFDSMSDMIFIMDMESRIIKINKAFNDTLDLKIGDIIGKKCYEVMHKSNVRWPSCPLIETVKNKRSNTAEVDDPAIGIPLLITTSPILDENGKMIGIVHVAKDITEIRKAEEAMKEAVDIKEQFISIASHELRAPMGIIKESIEIIADETAGKVGPSVNKFIDMARRNIARLVRLSNNLLEFQKLSAGKFEFNMTEGDINKTVKEAAIDTGVLAMDKGLEFLLNLPEGLPSIRFDKDAITGVVVNLINNAVKFTEKG